MVGSLGEQCVKLACGLASDARSRPAPSEYRLDPPPDDKWFNRIAIARIIIVQSATAITESQDSVLVSKTQILDPVVSTWHGHTIVQA